MTKRRVKCIFHETNEVKRLEVHHRLGSCQLGQYSIAKSQLVDIGKYRKRKAHFFDCGRKIILDTREVEQRKNPNVERTSEPQTV